MPTLTHEPTTCQVCGTPTEVQMYHVGGRGSVAYVVCPVGLEAWTDGKHRGIIREAKGAE